MLLSRRQLLFSFSGLNVIAAIYIMSLFWQDWAFSGRNDSMLRQSQRPILNEIPKKIWYKLGPSGLNDETRRWTSSCIDSNPGYEAEFMTDERADAYVESAFMSRPDIMNAYLGLTIPILKADLLRYLVLYDHGGIWFDLDVSCESVPIDDWIPTGLRHEAELVVGWEYDTNLEKYKARQFTSWIIMAKARSPHMLQVIQDILQSLQWIVEDCKVSIENITMTMIWDVVEFSGPRRLTRSVFESLNRSLNRTVEMDEVAGILEPKLVGNILVMPGRSFAAATNNYALWEEWSLSPTLVTHHYAGTWKNNHGAE